MANQEKIKKVYDAMSKNYNMPSFDEFSKGLDDVGNRRKVYDAMKEHYSMADDFDGFNSKLGFTDGLQPSADGGNGGNPNDPNSINYKRTNPEATENVWNDSLQAQTQPVDTSAVEQPETTEVPSANSMYALLSRRDQLNAKNNNLVAMMAQVENIKSHAQRLERAVKASKTQEELDFNLAEYKRVYNEYKQAADKYNSEFDKLNSDEAQYDNDKQAYLGQVVDGSTKVTPNGNGWTVGDELELDKLKENLDKAKKTAAAQVRTSQRRTSYGATETVEDYSAVDNKPVKEATKAYNDKIMAITGAANVEQAKAIYRTFQQDVAVDAVAPEVDRQLEAVAPVLDNAEQKWNDNYQAKMDEMPNSAKFGISPQAMAAPSADVAWHNPARADLDAALAAKHSLEAAKRQIEHYNIERSQRGDEGVWTFTKNAAKGFGERVTDISTWDCGITDFRDAAALLRAIEKKENNQPLTDAERAVLDAAALNMYVQACAKTGLGFQAGDVTAESIPFMLDMMINPIAKTGGSIAARTFRVLTKAAAERGAASALKLGGRRLAIDLLRQEASNLGRGALMAVDPMQIAKTEALIYNEHIGQVTGNFDKNGHYHYTGRMDGKDWGEAIVRGFGQQTIENASEFGGDTWMDGMGEIFKAIGGRQLNRLANSRAANMLVYAFEDADAVRHVQNGFRTANKWLERLGKKEYIQVMNDLRKQAHISGVIGETNEEVLGGLYNCIPFIGDEHLLTYTDENGEEHLGVLSPRRYVETAITMLPQQVMMGAMAGGIYGIKKYNANGLVNTSLATLRNMPEFRGMTDNEIRAKFDALNSDDFGRELVDYALTFDNMATRDAVMRMGINMQYAAGLDEAEKQDRVHDIPRAVYGAAYDKGREMLTDEERTDAAVMGSIAASVQGNTADQLPDAVNALMAQGRFVEALETAMQSNVPDEAMRALEQRISYEATAAGVMGRLAEDRDKEIADITAAIRARADKQGNVVTANYNGESVDVAAGVGTGSLSICHTDGSIEQVAEDAVTDMQSSAANDLIAAESERITQFYADKARAYSGENEMPKVGDTFTYLGMPCVLTSVDEQTGQAIVSFDNGARQQIVTTWDLTHIAHSEARQRHKDELQEIGIVSEEDAPTEQQPNPAIQPGAVTHSAEFKQLQDGETVTLADGSSITINPGSRQDNKTEYIFTKADGNSEVNVLNDLEIEQILHPAPVGGATVANAEPQQQEQPQAQARQQGVTPEIINEAMAEMGLNPSQVNVVTSPDQLPADQQQAADAIRRGEIVEGWYDPKSDKVFLYAPALADKNRTKQVILHELVSHKGLKDLLGNKFVQLCDAVWNYMPEADRRTWIAYALESAGKDVTTESVELSMQSAAYRRIAADEYMAHLAETGFADVEPSLLQQIIDAIRKVLQSLQGFEDVEMSDDFIKGLLTASYANLRKVSGGTEASSDAMPTKDGNVDWLAATPQRTLDYLTKEQGLTADETADFVAAQLKAAADDKNVPDMSQDRAADAQLDDYLVETYGNYTNIWNAYERGEILLSPELAAAIKAKVQFLEEGNMTPKTATIDDAIKFSIRVNHNSPYLLKKADGSFVDPETGERLGFDHRFMGSGEGAQAHGWGSYFSAKDIRRYAGDLGDDIIYKGAVSDDVKKTVVRLVLDRINIEGYSVRAAIKKETKDWEIEGQHKYIQAVKGLAAKDFVKSILNRHHYSVEIPDNDGTNYIEEDEPLTDEQIDRVLSLLDLSQYRDGFEERFRNGYTWQGETTPRANGRMAYKQVVSEYGSEEKASKILHDAGFVGIHYDGRQDGECYVIFDENDAKIVDHVRFSKKERKTLMGVHNISEAKLKKAIKLGGLANPSMAVIDTDKGMHTDFGEISLIPKSSMIEASTGRNAGTYTGDAWTSTYPHVETLLTKQGEESIKRIADAAAPNDGELRRRLYRDLVDYANGNARNLHLLYLLQTGKNPAILKKSPIHTHEEYETAKQLLGDGFQNVTELTKEQNDALLQQMINHKIEGKGFDEATKQSLAEQLAKRYADENGNLYFNRWDTYLYDVWKDEQARQAAETDWNRTESEAENRVVKEGLSEDYNRWKESLFGDGDIQERIFAGFTPSGNRRYLPNTPQNASKLMNQEASTNAYGSGGLNATRSTLLKKMRTLSAIRKNRDLLQGDEVYKEKQEEMSDELFDIISKISDLQTINGNRFINDDYTEHRLQEAIVEKDPIGYLNKEYGYDIDPKGDLAEQIRTFIKDAANLPVKYFETKFKRPVSLDEFSIAVIPETTSEDVVKALKDAGLDVRTYDNSGYANGDYDAANANRTKAIMEAIDGRDDIRFSRRKKEVTPEEDAAYMEAVNRGDMETAQRMVNEAAASRMPNAQRGIFMGSFFSGAGTIEDGLRDIVSPLLGVESDKDIADVYRSNHGNQLQEQDIRDLDIDELPNINYLHASPVCHNFSATGDHEEQTLDEQTAKKTAEAIRKKRPRIVTIENAPSYRDSRSVEYIKDALREQGYKFDEGLYKASDFGGTMERKRYIIRAVLDGELPAIEKSQAQPWGERVSMEEMQSLKDGELRPFQKAALAKAGIDENHPPKEPVLIFGGGKAGANELARWSYASELAKSIVASPRGSMDYIVLPDGKVKELNSRILAKIMGLSDSFVLPDDYKLARQVIGNGMSGDLVRGVIKPLFDGRKVMMGESGRMKLLDAVTYDDNGNVIPLSERFNESNEDVRFSRVEANNRQPQTVSFLDMGLTFGGYNQEQVKELNKWLKDNPDKYVRLYHGTSADNTIMQDGIKKTSNRNKHSYQSENGYVYLSIYPSSARMFGELGSNKQGNDVKVYAVDVKVKDLRPDTDQLRNKRAFGGEEYENMGDTLAESILYGSGARVKRAVLPDEVSETRFSRRPFAERQREAVERKGIVAPNLASKSVEVVEADAKHGFKNNKAAIDWSKENIIKTYTDEETGGKGNITIPASALSKFISNAAVAKSENRDVHLATLKVLPQLLAESIDAEQHANYQKINGVRGVENPVSPNEIIHRLYGAVGMDGKTYRVKITLKELSEGTRNTYSYETTKIELLNESNSSGIGEESVVHDYSPQTRVKISAAKLLQGVEKSYEKGKYLLDESENLPENVQNEEENVRFSRVTDPQKLDELNNGKTIKVYRAMQLQDGKLYPPMSGMVDGKWQNAQEMGEWYQSDERPDLLDKKGKFVLKKNPQDSGMPVAYNPYWHTSRFPLNDQFASAWNRPELVTVEVEIPESELTSGYKAEGAKNAVGETTWKAGPVADKLYGTEDERKVILSRYNRLVRIVPDSEVAASAARILKKHGLAVPFNVVTPSLRDELVKQGVTIGAPTRHGSGVKSVPAYEQWTEGVRFSRRPATALIMTLQDKPLRDQMGSEQWTDEMRRLYATMGESERRQIVHKMLQSGGRGALANAMSGWMADRVFGYDEQPDGWDEVCNSVRRWTRGLGYDGVLTDGECDYVIWRSNLAERQGGRMSVRDMVADTLLRERLGIDTDDLDPNDGVRFSKVFGGNSGYVGYSKSRRAVRAEEAGLRNKSQMDKEFADEVNELILAANPNAEKVTLKQIKDALSDIKADEWHHTSMYGNRTNYYSAETIAEYFTPETEEEKAAREDRETLQSEYRKAYAAVENAVWENVPHETIEDPMRIQVGGRDMFRTSAGHLVEHTKNVLSLSSYSSTKIIPSGLDYLVDGYDKWAYEHSKEYETAIDEYNAAKREAFDHIPQEMKDKVRDLHEKLESVRFSRIKPVNDKFNEELQQQIDGTLPMGHTYQLGMPSEILRSAGIANLPIELQASRLSDKSMQENHPFDLSEAMDLPRAIQEPLAVFRSATHIGDHVILTSLKHDGRNFVAAIRVNKIGKKIEVNSIRSLHYRNGLNIVGWINEGLADYIKPSFADEWLEPLKKELRPKPQYNSADVRAQLESAAKIVRDFQNPKLSGEKVEDKPLFSRQPRSVDDEIRQSRPRRPLPRTTASQSVAGRIYNEGVMGFWNDIKEGYHDYLRSVRVLQEAVAAESGKPLQDHENVYLHNLFLQRRNQAEWQQYMNRLVEPLLDTIKGITRNAKDKEAAEVELGRYLNAVHGLERNEYMAKQHPKTPRKDYSGLTAIFTRSGETNVPIDELEQRARDFIADYESRIGDKAKDELWAGIDGLRSFMLDKMYNSGLITKALHDELKDRYKHYVPLRGWRDETKGTAEDFYNYVSEGGGNGESIMQKAEGRNSEAADILATLMHLGHAAIHQGNKNRALQSLLALAEDHKVPLLTAKLAWYEKQNVGGVDTWVIIAPPDTSAMNETDAADALNQFEADMRAKMQAEPTRYKNGGSRVDVGVPVNHIGNLKQHQVRVMRGGKMYIININGQPKAAQALNGQLKEKAPGWVEGLNRFIARNLTTLNPEFIVSNFERDFTSANVMTFARYGLKEAAKMDKSMFNNLWRLFSLYEKGQLDMNNEQHRLFDEFMRNGGETGFGIVLQTDDYQKRIMDAVKNKHHVVEAILSVIEAGNRGIENMMRFAAYIVARKSGRSILQAINDSAEVSVNFNRTGSGAMGAKYFKGLYVFFNAGVQGLAQRLQGLFQLNPRMYAAIGCEMALGFLISALNIYWGGDDDDDELDEPYMRLGEFRRYNSINIMLPWWDKALRWDLSHEDAAWYGIGAILGEYAMGYHHDNEFAKLIFGQLTQALPIDLAAYHDGDMGIIEAPLRELMPTALRPWMEAYSWNEDFQGRPINNQKVKGELGDNSILPEYRRVTKRNEISLANAVVEWMDKANGADDYHRSWYEKALGNFAPNADNINYIVGGYLGGPWTFMNKVRMTMSGEAELRDYPIASRLMTDIGSDYAKNRQLKSEFDYYHGMVEETENREKVAKRDYKEANGKKRISRKDEAKAYELLEDDFGYRLQQIWKSGRGRKTLEKRYEKAVEERKQLYKIGDTEGIERNQAEIYSIMRDAVKAWREAE